MGTCGISCFESMKLTFFSTSTRKFVPRFYYFYGAVLILRETIQFNNSNAVGLISYLVCFFFCFLLKKKKMRIS